MDNIVQYLLFLLSVEEHVIIWGYDQTHITEELITAQVNILQDILQDNKEECKYTYGIVMYKATENMENKLVVSCQFLGGQILKNHHPCKHSAQCFEFE